MHSGDYDCLDSVSIFPGECPTSFIPNDIGCGNPPREIVLSFFDPEELAVMPASPPIFVLSTTLYQLQSIDSIEGSTLPLEGTIWTQPRDAVNSDFAMLEGVLREPVVRVDFGPDSVDSDFAMLAGILNEIVVRITKDPDAVESDFVMMDGTLVEVVIRYDYSEAVESDFAMIGGVLT